MALYYLLGTYTAVYRVLWWQEEKSLEAGLPADAQLLLQGHAGLTSPSPQDIKEMGGDSRLVAIFGKSIDKQERWVFLTSSSEEKASLVHTIEESIKTKAD